MNTSKPVPSLDTVFPLEARPRLFEKAQVAFHYWQTLQDSLWCAAWVSFLTGLPMPLPRV